MIVNKIKKMTKGRYKIIFDNNEDIVLYEDIIIKYNLLTKKNIDETLLNSILKDNYYAGIYSDALKYISTRMRSRKEVNEYLLKKYPDESIVNDTMDKLSNHNYINDTLFCKSFINDKLYLSNDGLDKIKQTLLNHDININIIDEAISKIDSNLISDKLYKLIEKYIRVNNKFSNNQLRNKALNYFINIGYNKDMITEIYNTFEIKQNDDVVKKEYDKLYKKYSNKYTGYKLSTYIKSRLYQKGFSTEEIEKNIK